MVYLIDNELSFIERKTFGPNHIARKLNAGRGAQWYTYCGRAWHPNEVSEWTARESGDDDPEVLVCRACKKYAPDGAIRIED